MASPGVSSCSLYYYSLLRDHSSRSWSNGLYNYCCRTSRFSSNLAPYTGAAVAEFCMYSLVTSCMSSWLQVSAQVPELCVLFHESVQALSQRFLAQERRHVYITPTSYLELIHSYKTLLSKKQNEVPQSLLHSRLNTRPIHVWIFSFFRGLYRVLHNLCHSFACCSVCTNIILRMIGLEPMTSCFCTACCLHAVQPPLKLPLPITQQQSTRE